MVSNFSINDAIKLIESSNINIDFFKFVYNSLESLNAKYKHWKICKNLFMIDFLNDNLDYPLEYEKLINFNFNKSVLNKIKFNYRSYCLLVTLYKIKNNQPLKHYLDENIKEKYKTIEEVYSTYPLLNNKLCVNINGYEIFENLSTKFSSLNKNSMLLELTNCIYVCIFYIKIYRFTTIFETLYKFMKYNLILKRDKFRILFEYIYSFQSLEYEKFKLKKYAPSDKKEINNIFCRHDLNNKGKVLVIETNSDYEESDGESLKSAYENEESDDESLKSAYENEESDGESLKSAYENEDLIDNSNNNSDEGNSNNKIDEGNSNNNSDGGNSNNNSYGGNSNDKIYGGNSNNNSDGGNSNNNSEGGNSNDKIYDGDANNKPDNGYSNNNSDENNSNNKTYKGNSNNKTYEGNSDSESDINENLDTETAVDENSDTETAVDENSNLESTVQESTVQEFTVQGYSSEKKSSKFNIKNVSSIYEKLHSVHKSLIDEDKSLEIFYKKLVSSEENLQAVRKRLTDKDKTLSFFYKNLIYKEKNLINVYKTVLGCDILSDNKNRISSVSEKVGQKEKNEGGESFGKIWRSLKNVDEVSSGENLKSVDEVSSGESLKSVDEDSDGDSLKSVDEDSDGESLKSVDEEEYYKSLAVNKQKGKRLLKVKNVSNKRKITANSQSKKQVKTLNNVMNHNLIKNFMLNK